MQVKVCVIGAANTVIDPWTVVVIAVDTLVADIAMSALWQSNHFAERA